MSPDIVVDIGNTRIKFGRCTSAPGITELASLSPDDPEAWKSQAEAWGVPFGGRFAIASVVPSRAARLWEWIEAAGYRATMIQDPLSLPLHVAVPEPTKVGIDRLLSATAAHRRAPGRPIIVATAGTAVTVDFVSAEGRFIGGAIFPGFGTMLHSLHEHTALLPDVAIQEPVRHVVGTNTIEAMKSGVFWSVVGGISSIAMHGQQTLGLERPKLFITGGDGHLLEGHFHFDPEIVPTLTLEGIRLAAEALP